MKLRKGPWLGHATVATVVCLLLVGGGYQMTVESGGHPPPSFDELRAQLGDGPVQVQSAQLSHMRLAQGAAEQTVQKCGGNATVKPRNSWPVRFTDREFMGGKVKDRLAWLLEYDAGAFLAKDLTAKIPFCYAVVDDASGSLLEFFTRPETAWWEGLPLREGKLLSYFVQRGWRSRLSVAEPKAPLRDVLREMADGSYSEPFEEAKQFIIRLYAFTDLSEGIGIERVDSAEIVPRHLEQPVWQICLAGVTTRNLSRRPVTYKELTLLIDATNAKVIQSTCYR